MNKLGLSCVNLSSSAWATSSFAVAITSTVLHKLAAAGKPAWVGAWIN